MLDADAAADAALGDDARPFHAVFARRHLGGRAGGVFYLRHLNGVDGAYFFAFAAADAFGLFDSGDVIRADRLRDAETLDREQRLAAAGAAVTDEVDTAAHILPELHEVVVVGLREQVAALRGLHLARVAVLDQRRRRGVEGHANVHRRVADRAGVQRLMAAVAHADADVRGGVDDICRAFVIEHVQRVFVGYLRFLREDAPHLDVAAADEVAHEVLLYGDVLVKKFAEGLLVDILAHAHQRELKESGHRRRHGVDLPAVLFDVDDDGAAGQFVKRFLRLAVRKFPYLRRLMGAEGLYRKLGHQPRLPLRHQNFQYIKKQLRFRRALRESVEPLREAGVGRPMSVVMCHKKTSCT